MPPGWRAPLPLRERGGSRRPPADLPRGRAMPRGRTSSGLRSSPPCPSTRSSRGRWSSRYDVPAGVPGLRDGRHVRCGRVPDRVERDQARGTGRGRVPLRALPSPVPSGRARLGRVEPLRPVLQARRGERGRTRRSTSTATTSRPRSGSSSRSTTAYETTDRGRARPRARVALLALVRGQRGPGRVPDRRADPRAPGTPDPGRERVPGSGPGPGLLGVPLVRRMLGEGRGSEVRGRAPSPRGLPESVEAGPPGSGFHLRPTLAEVNPRPVG